jgi:hypothetical protein
MATSNSDLALAAPRSGPQIRNPNSLLAPYEFPSLSPPDIHKNSHIIAVCGVNDLEEMSSPVDGNGWMHSDMLVVLPCIPPR